MGLGEKSGLSYCSIPGHPTLFSHAKRVVNLKGLCVNLKVLTALRNKVVLVLLILERACVHACVRGKGFSVISVSYGCFGNKWS